MHAQTIQDATADQAGRADPVQDFRSAWLRQIATDRRLVGQAPRVAIAISDHISSSYTTQHSQEQIARDLKITDRTVRAAVAALIDRGHLKIATRRRHGRPNVMRLLLIGGRSDV